MKRLQLTPIFIISTISLLIYLFYFIRYLIQGYEEGAAITGMICLILIVILGVERFIISFIKGKKLIIWLCETLIIITFFILANVGVPAN